MGSGFFAPSTSCDATKSVTIYSHNTTSSVHIQAVFPYCCPDCPANAIQMDQVAWAIWASIKNYSLSNLPTYVITSVYPLAAATCSAVAPVLGCGTSVSSVRNQCSASRSINSCSSLRAASASTSETRKQIRFESRLIHIQLGRYEYLNTKLVPYSFLVMRFTCSKYVGLMTLTTILTTLRTS